MMRFAFSTILCAPRFGWQPAPEKHARCALYAQAREIGFTGIEWSPRWLDYHQSSNAEIEALAREVIDCELAVSAFNLNRFLLLRCEQADEHYRRLLRTIEVAPYFGAECVIISLSMPHPPTQNRARVTSGDFSDDEFRHLATLLRVAADRAEYSGILLVLELHDDGLLDTPQQCLRMLYAIDHPSVRINPDLGNLIRVGGAGELWRDALLLLAPHAGYWHMKNYCNGQPTPIWEGDIDYADALKTMRASGYDGWVSFESYTSGDVMKLQRQSLHWSRNLLLSIHR